MGYGLGTGTGNGRNFMEPPNGLFVADEIEQMKTRVFIEPATMAGLGHPPFLALGESERLEGVTFGFLNVLVKKTSNPVNLPEGSEPVPKVGQRSFQPGGCRVIHDGHFLSRARVADRQRGEVEPRLPVNPCGSEPLPGSLAECHVGPRGQAVNLAPGTVRQGIPKFLGNESINVTSRRWRLDLIRRLLS
jgi:hypothetical protein